MSTRPVLITGFEPYGGHRTNPSHDVMKRLDGRTIAGKSVVGRGLPVASGSFPAIASQLIEELNPQCVISLGLWPGESMIRIERIAVNIADFGIPDNAGIKAIDELVMPDGATALMSTLPVRKIEQALLADGIPAALSATAGTYLCNMCLYSFLQAADRHTEPVACGFIHVPYSPEQVAERMVETHSNNGVETHQQRNLASMSLEHTQRAVEIAVAQ